MTESIQSQAEVLCVLLRVLGSLEKEMDIHFTEKANCLVDPRFVPGVPA